MFIVYHFTWERKPSYSDLICDGFFPTWDDAFRAVFNNVINGDTDPGEICDGTETPPLLYEGPIPRNVEEMKIYLPNNDCWCDVIKFSHEQFADFMCGMRNDSKRFHIKKLP